jgi:hypothetical protein
LYALSLSIQLLQLIQELLQKPFLNLIQAGVTIRLNLAALKDLTKSEIIAPNATPQISLTPLTTLASHALQTTNTVILLKDANASLHAVPLELLIQQITNVNAKL